MAIYINGVNIDGGGGASLPGTPADVLEDASAPDTFVGLDSAGRGTAMTPAQASALLSRAATTTYDFSSSSGVTLVNGTVGGTAAVVGGVLRCTVPATPAARYYNGFLEAPYGQVSVPRDLGGRQPMAWRAWARLAGVAADTIAYFLALSSDGAQRMGLYVGSDGSGNAENNAIPAGLAVPFPAGTVPLNGSGYLAIDVLGTVASFLYGTGTPTAPPATWTTHAVATLPAVSLWTNVQLVGASNSAPGVPSDVEYGDLVFEVT